MAGLLPPVIATLIADTKEYMVKMSEAQTKMTEFGTTAELTGAKMKAFGSKASSAIIGLGAVIIGLGVDSALKFTETLRQIENQSNLTADQVKTLGNTIMDLSNLTAISTSDLGSAALAIAQAGFKGAEATKFLTDASKAAVITNASVIDTTKALISAQTLQIAKGMDVTKLTGILVAGSKTYVGGLAAEESMLSGRVGVALANYGLKLKDIIGIGSTFAGVQLPTRSIVSFTQGLNNLLKPTTDAKGKLTTYDKSLQRLGLSQAKLATDFRNGNLIGMFKEINRAAKEGGGPLSAYVNAVFGSSGGAAASVIIKNLAKYEASQKNLSDKGAASLAKSFGIATAELPFKLKQIKTEAKNALTGIGLVFLPTLTDLANWSANAVKFFKKHPLMQTIATDSAISLFVGAILFKLGQGISGVVKSIRSVYQTITKTSSDAIAKTQGATQISLLTEIAANTLAMSGELGVVSTEAGLIAGTSATTATEAGIIAAEGGLSKAALLQYLPEIALLIATAFSLKYLIVDPVKNAINEIKNGIDGGAGLPDPNKTIDPKTDPNAALVQWLSRAAPAVPKGSSGWFTGKQNLGNINGQPALQTYRITNEQKSAIDNYFKTHHMSETDKNGVATAAFSAAIQAMEMSDVNKKYSVTVRVK